MEPYIIRVSSTKGGVGKSVISTNLAVALRRRGYEVLLVDTDFVNPCVGVYLGLEHVNTGLQTVMKRRGRLESAIITHNASGVRVLPQTLYDEVKPTSAMIGRMNKELKKLPYDFVIVDTEPGLQWPETLKSYNEALIVTIPTEAACISAVKLMQRYKRINLKTTVIVNRRNSGGPGLSLREIESLVEENLAAVLDEDDQVLVGVTDRIPICLLNRRARFSKEFESLASLISSRRGEPSEQGRGERKGIFRRIRERLFG